jgi:hypothetical protein
VLQTKAAVRQLELQLREQMDSMRNALQGQGESAKTEIIKKFQQDLEEKERQYKEEIQMLENSHKQVVAAA